MAESSRTCHEKILSETGTISSAIQSLEARFGDIEDQLRDITSNVDDLVQSSKRMPAASVDTRQVEVNRWKRKQSLMELSAKPPRPYNECEGFGSQSLSQWDDLTHAHNLDDWDAAQQHRSLHRSLQLIEETRTKRRRTKFFHK